MKSSLGRDGRRFFMAGAYALIVGFFVGIFGFDWWQGCHQNPQAGRRRAEAALWRAAKAESLRYVYAFV
jgi:hypothetical protein